MSRNKNRLVVANGKGGVTKTTTTCEVAAHASRRKKKILLVDMDPQSNSSSTILGYIPPSTQKTIFDLLIDEQVEIRGVLKKGSNNWPNIWILPSNQKLSTAYKFLETEPNWISRLDEISQQIEHNFDAIIIDTPPSMGLLTKMSIRAANKLLIPTDTSMYSDDGGATILALVNHIERKTGHKLETVKLILAMQQKKNSFVTKNALEYLSETYNEIFMRVDLPHCTKAQEAHRRYEPPKSAMSLLPSDHKLFKGYEKISSALIS